MGKTRRNKNSFFREQNYLTPSRDVEFIEENEEGNYGPIESIREQLQSGILEEKLNGLQALAVLTANKDNVVKICSSDVIRIAAPLLIEKNDSVRNSAAGSLRNLSLNGLEACEYMVDQDILTPLLALIKEYAEDREWIPSFDNSRKDQLDLKSDIFLQAINLFWNLCESSSTAVETFNHMFLLESIIRCLDHKLFGIDIAISVAQCILVISENNRQSWNILRKYIPEFLSLLGMDLDYEHSYLRTLIAGILSNVPALSAAYSSDILKALVKTVEENSSKALTNIVENHPINSGQEFDVPEIEVKMDETEETSEEKGPPNIGLDLPNEADIARKSIKYLLDAQRLSAEIITNLCSFDEEECENIDDNDMSDGESVHDYDVLENNCIENMETVDKLPMEILEIFKSLDIFRKLWELVQPLQYIRTEDVDILSKVQNLRVSALVCLQNMCNIMRLEDLGEPSYLYNIWIELGQQVFKGLQDPLLLEPITSFMRSLLNHLNRKIELFNKLTSNDIELILKGVDRYSNAEIRANWLRMLGTLGCLLPESLVKDIISFILESCDKEEDVWTISEAIDSLMDIFSDNDWSQIVSELHLLERIQNLDKSFKSKVRQQKRELNERYPAVQTVRGNFTRFIKYIEKEYSKYDNNLMH